MENKYLIFNSESLAYCIVIYVNDLDVSELDFKLVSQNRLIVYHKSEQFMLFVPSNIKVHKIKIKQHNTALKIEVFPEILDINHLIEYE